MVCLSTVFCGDDYMVLQLFLIICPPCLHIVHMDHSKCQKQVRKVVFIKAESVHLSQGPKPSEAPEGSRFIVRRLVCGNFII